MLHFSVLLLVLNTWGVSWKLYFFVWLLQSGFSGLFAVSNTHVLESISTLLLFLCRQSRFRKLIRQTSNYELYMLHLFDFASNKAIKVLYERYMAAYWPPLSLFQMSPQQILAQTSGHAHVLFSQNKIWTFSWQTALLPVTAALVSQCSWYFPVLAKLYLVPGFENLSPILNLCRKKRVKHLWQNISYGGLIPNDDKESS